MGFTKANGMPVGVSKIGNKALAISSALCKNALKILFQNN